MIKKVNNIHLRRLLVLVVFPVAVVLTPVAVLLDVLLDAYEELCSAMKDCWRSR